MPSTRAATALALLGLAAPASTLQVKENRGPRHTALDVPGRGTVYCPFELQITKSNQYSGVYLPTSQAPQGRPVSGFMDVYNFEKVSLGIKLGAKSWQ